jgi:hypothetical protein
MFGTDRAGSGGGERGCCCSSRGRGGSSSGSRGYFCCERTLLAIKSALFVRRAFLRLILVLVRERHHFLLVVVVPALLFRGRRGGTRCRWTGRRCCCCRGGCNRGSESGGSCRRGRRWRIVVFGVIVKQIVFARRFSAQWRSSWGTGVGSSRNSGSSGRSRYGRSTIKIRQHLRLRPHGHSVQVAERRRRDAGSRSHSRIRMVRIGDLRGPGKKAAPVWPRIVCCRPWLRRWTWRGKCSAERRLRCPRGKEKDRPRRPCWRQWWPTRDMRADQRQEE